MSDKAQHCSETGHPGPTGCGDTSDSVPISRTQTHIEHTHPTQHIAHTLAPCRPFENVQNPGRMGNVMVPAWQKTDGSCQSTPGCLMYSHPQPSCYRAALERRALSFPISVIGAPLMRCPESLGLGLNLRIYTNQNQWHLLLLLSADSLPGLCGCVYPFPGLGG